MKRGEPGGRKREKEACFVNIIIMVMCIHVHVYHSCTCVFPDCSCTLYNVIFIISAIWHM